MGDPLNRLEDFIDEQAVEQQLLARCQDVLSHHLENTSLKTHMAGLATAMTPPVVGAALSMLEIATSKDSAEKSQPAPSKNTKGRGDDSVNEGLRELVGMEDEGQRIEQEERKRRKGQERMLREKLEQEAKSRQEEEERQRTHEIEVKRPEALKKHFFSSLGLENLKWFARSIKKKLFGVDIEKRAHSGLYQIRMINSDVADRFCNISELERTYKSEFYDDLILLQCVQIERLLVELLLADSFVIADQIKKQLRPEQQKIVEYYFSKDQRATLGFIHLWLIGLRRALKKTSESENSTSYRWMEQKFGPVTHRGDVYDPFALFTEKGLISFTNRLRENYRNPLVHPRTKNGRTYDKSQYRQWCQDSYGKKNISGWLKMGWTGVNGWMSVLTASGAQSRKR